LEYSDIYIKIGEAMEENREKNPNQRPRGNEGANKDRRNNEQGAGAGQKKNDNAHYHKKKRYYNNKHKKKPHANREDEAIINEAIEEAIAEPVAESAENEVLTAVPEEAVSELIEDVAEAEAPEAPEAEEEKPPKSSVMVEVVGIRFKSTGKTYYFDPAGITLRKGEHAIVETARGLEYGEVALANSSVSESDIVPPLRPVVRKATEADKAHHLENKKKEDDAFVLCNERILAHKLDMKLIDAQYTFDNSKLLFYFTSAGRVDFRELVKDLASVFRTRIELRQIGIRDEAKLIGGLGMCGRPLCCSVFLTDFGQVSIKMAKEQNLSLNSAKISGICGRLMCCLRYEHESYEYEIKRTPPIDSTVKTPDGIGTVTEMSPLQGTIKVRLADKPDTQPKTYHRKDVTVISK
jgi:cell fate regulator YaaT (PSP1 superfamily)